MSLTGPTPTTAAPGNVASVGAAPWGAALAEVVAALLAQEGPREVAVDDAVEVPPGHEQTVGDLVGFRRLPGRGRRGYVALFRSPCTARVVWVWQASGWLKRWQSLTPDQLARDLPPATGVHTWLWCRGNIWTWATADLLDVFLETPEDMGNGVAMVVAELIAETVDPRERLLWQLGRHREYALLDAYARGESLD